MPLGWRTKVGVQRLISLIPGSAPFLINELLTRLVRGKAEHRINFAQRFEKGIDNLYLLQSKGGIHVDGKVVLELGTGWHGIDLILFYLLGAERIYSLDHYPHLKYRTFESVVSWIVTVGEALVQRSGLGDARLVKSRLADLERLWKQSGTLNEIFRRMNVECVVIRSCRTKPLHIAPRSIDIVYSESVLQRIPEYDLRETLNDLAKRLMSESGGFFHRINPLDINSHLDQRLWYLHYLKYNDFFFQHFYSGKLNSQNRLRESDFIDLFRATGSEVTYVASYIVEEDIKRLERFSVNQRFSNKSIEDLATWRSKVVGRIAQGSKGVSPLHEVFFTSGYTSLD